MGGEPVEKEERTALPVEEVEDDHLAAAAVEVVDLDPGILHLVVPMEDLVVDDQSQTMLA